MIQVRVRLFGALRRFGNGQDLSLDLPRGTSLDALREALARRMAELDGHFDASQLLRDSAIANEEEILPREAALETSVTLAVLPPVCGG